MTFKRNTVRFQAALCLLLNFYCVGCETKTTINSCPPWPNPGRNVADELEKYCYPESKCPYTWEWIDRLYILRDQLEIKTDK